MDKDKRKAAAIQIANNPNILAYLQEMFVPEYSALHNASEKNILALDDEQYGKAMKLFYIKRTENQAAIDEMKLLGHKTTGKPRNSAPV